MKNKDKVTVEDIEQIELQDLLEEVEETVKLSFNVENEYPPVVVPEGNIITKDSLRWKVEALRLQGIDDNRIAAMLEVSKFKVQEIK